MPFLMLKANTNKNKNYYSLVLPCRKNFNKSRISDFQCDIVMKNIWEVILMLTIEKLEELGVNTKEGLNRCMNKEVFYFRMLKMGLANESFEKLEKELAEGKLKDAFESAHALKGVLGNLALTPLYKPLAEMTEMLRAKREADYVTIYKPILELRNKLLALA